MKTVVKLGLGAIVVAAALLFTPTQQANAHPYGAYRPAYPVAVRAYYPPRRAVYRAYYPRVYTSYYAPAVYAPAPVYYGGYGGYGYGYGGYGCGW